MSHSPFAAAFVPGTRFVGAAIVMSTREIGVLQVPSGRVAVGDPGVTEFDGSLPALARRVPAGSFPVELALAHLDGPDTRVACARVRFAPGPAVRWQAARLESEAEDGEASGYGVDCGMGCFFDAAARVTVDEAVMRVWTAAMDRNRTDTWTWHVAPAGEANVVMFASGWGDGFYTTYWGFDAQGEAVELVTDFDVLVEPVYERFELPLPLPYGGVEHPWLTERGISVRRPLFAPRTALVGGRTASVELSEFGLVTRDDSGRDSRMITWKHDAPGLRLVITVCAGTRPLVAE